MIEIWIHSRKLGWHLRPSEDSLPVCTWRGEGDYTQRQLRGLHRYPQAGCQGEPLPERKPCRKLPLSAKEQRSLPAYESAFGCGACACEETP